MTPVSNPPPPPGVVSPQWVPPPPAVAPHGQPLASFSDRLLAYLIDYLIYIGVSLILTIPFLIWWFSAFFSWLEESMPPPGVPADEVPPPDMAEFWALYIPMLIYVGASILFMVIYTYLYWVELQKRWGGQTVGKRVMKIRVIPANPARTEIGRGGFTIRWAIEWMVGAVVPLFNLFDGLWQLWDKPLQQCLHDKAAETVVVKVG
jgi:uncharacterized RDD family membrane protein YckC